MNNDLNQMPIPNGMGFNNVQNTIEGVQPLVSEQPKPYTLRKLKATELFPMLNILRKIGFKRYTEILQNDDIKNIIAGLKNGEIADDTLIGIGSVVFELLEIILDGAVNCENELFTILANVSGKKVEEVKQLDLDVMISMIIELIKDNMDFIKAASKYLK